MDLKSITRHDISDLTDHELSAIQAGLKLLASNGQAGNLRYPEYKVTASKMLGSIGVAGYSYSKSEPEPDRSA